MRIHSIGLCAIPLALQLLTGCARDRSPDFQTFCNPLDLSYRFGIEPPSRREAADPTVIFFRDRYFLFASKSGGYWHSKDLVEWTFLATNEIPVEEYAPTAIVINDWVYFLASSNERSTIYRSSDPLSGRWEVARDSLCMPVWDPDFFLDDDGRLYLYWGCSNVNPLFGVEVDYSRNFEFIGEPRSIVYANPNELGWEVPGDYNTLIGTPPWIEGPTMMKHNGLYYLQYSAPGTEFKSYCDAVYVSRYPLGPFTLAPHNPFAYKPEGFAAGAGHGSSFHDPHGNLWHMGTMTISIHHIFERRLGLFPAFLDGEGNMFAVTRFGDYPLIVPNRRVESFEELFPGWMLLSYRKDVSVSSANDSFPASLMTDEDIRTWWVAARGDDAAWVVLDMGEEFDVYALQLNFAEHNANAFGRQEGLYYQYVVEHSRDQSRWELLIDNSQGNTDHPHAYFQLPESTTTRYLRIRDITVPSGDVAISGFRVFGKGHGDRPPRITRLHAQRNASDRRSVTLSWERAQGATGYNIGFGAHRDRMHLNYMVYSDTSITINSLNVNWPYYFTIEAFNEHGITPSELVSRVN